jgi:hypothetical protein
LDSINADQGGKKLTQNKVHGLLKLVSFWKHLSICFCLVYFRLVSVSLFLITHFMRENGNLCVACIDLE